MSRTSLRVSNGTDLLVHRKAVDVRRRGKELLESARSQVLVQGAVCLCMSAAIDLRR